MKFIASLTCLLLITIATPTFALQGGDCSARSEKLKQNDRAEFMKSCLAQAQDPANVREEERKQKDARCEQNAKNMKLQGKEKADYHANCMNKNEAATMADAQLKKTAEPKHRASSSTPKNTPRHKVSKKNKVHKKSPKKNSKQSAKPADENKEQ